MVTRNRATKLSRNFLSIAAGAMSAQVVGALMMPFLTAHMTTAEYGAVDLSLGFIALVAPVVSLSISEAVLRFGMNREKQPQAVFVTGLAAVVFGLLASLLLLPFLANTSLAPFISLIYCLLTANMLAEVSGQFLRSQDRVALVAAVGVVQALLVAGGNLLLVGVLEQGARGNLMAMIAGSALASGALVGMIVYRTRPKIMNFSSSLLRKMLVYSAPLTPNATLWWAVSFSSRVILMIMVGPSAVGLFAVAARVPALLSLATGVFWQAWQLSAIEEKDSPTKQGFQARVLAALSGTLLIGMSVLLSSLFVLMGLLVSDEFGDATLVVPPLLGAAGFLAWSSFWGTEYRVQMTTGNVLWTSAIGAVAAVCLSPLLILPFGVVGAAFANCCGYAIIWLLRIWDLGRRGWRPAGMVRLGVGIAVVTLQASSLYVSLGSVMRISISTICLLLLVALFGRALVAVGFAMRQGAHERG